MTEFTKRIFQTLARAILAAVCQRFGKADSKGPGVRVNGARKSQTTSKTTKKRRVKYENH